MSKGAKAVFLDRDGTINRDPGYLSDPGDLELFDNTVEAVEVIKSQGFRIVVVSNQSGIGRGILTEINLADIHKNLNQLLGGAIDAFYYCSHRPDENCKCRKPEPELLFVAARELGLDLQSSIMVGDRLKDLQAGRRAGCSHCALVRTGMGASEEAEVRRSEGADYVGSDLLEVAIWIKNGCMG